jgi:hypothetical protein
MMVMAMLGLTGLFIVSFAAMMAELVAAGETSPAMKGGHTSTVAQTDRLTSTTPLTAMLTSTPTLQMLIPLYSYPNWYNPADYIWDDVAAANSQVSITAIINPNNGPGSCPPNDDYLHGLSDLRNAGVMIVGYVYTSYGARPLEDAKADVDLYDQCFAIDGIFFDETASDVVYLTYYKELYDYVKMKSNLYKVILNPGTHIDEGYISQPASDIAVISEGYSCDWPPYQPDSYVTDGTYPADRFAVLIHSVPSVSIMQAHIKLAIARNIGYVYVTDDGPPNPWDSLPSFWQAEISYLQSPDMLTATKSVCLYLLFILQNP